MFIIASNLGAASIEITDEAVLKDPSVTENRVTINPRGGEKHWKESIGHNPWQEGVKPFDQCYLIAFRLPHLETGEVFVDVKLKVCPFIAANLNKREFVDLYGLGRVSDDADFKESDYFEGENDITSTKIQEGLFTMDTVMGVNSSVTEAIRVVDITDWMNQIYKKGENAGKYVFLRFNMNVEHPKSNYDMLSLGSEGRAKISYSIKTP